MEENYKTTGVLKNVVILKDLICKIIKIHISYINILLSLYHNRIICLEFE